MNLPENTHLAYIVRDEAWYAHRPGMAEGPQMYIEASASGGGVAWEFAVEEGELGGEQVTRVLVFEDAYPAFADLPEFFARLAAERPCTITAVRVILDDLGAVDETPRTDPYGGSAEPASANLRKRIEAAVEAMPVHPC